MDRQSALDALASIDAAFSALLPSATAPNSSTTATHESAAWKDDVTSAVRQIHSAALSVNAYLQSVVNSQPKSELEELEEEKQRLAGEIVAKQQLLDTARCKLAEWQAQQQRLQQLYEDSLNASMAATDA